MPPPGCDGKMTQAGKKKKRAVNRSIMLAKKIIIKDGGTVRPGARTARGQLTAAAAGPGLHGGTGAGPGRARPSPARVGGPAGLGRPRLCRSRCPHGRRSPDGRARQPGPVSAGRLPENTCERVRLLCFSRQRGFFLVGPGFWVAGASAASGAGPGARRVVTAAPGEQGMSEPTLAERGSRERRLRGQRRVRGCRGGRERCPRDARGQTERAREGDRRQRLSSSAKNAWEKGFAVLPTVLLPRKYINSKKKGSC